MTIKDYKAEEAIIDVLSNSADLQAYVNSSNIYTAYITDIQDPDFPCITVRMPEGHYLEDSDDISFNDLEIEILTDHIGGGKVLLDDIYAVIQGLIHGMRITNNDSTYSIIVFGRRKARNETYYDDSKNRTIYKKIKYYEISVIKI